jgi:SprT protein
MSDSLEGGGGEERQLFFSFERCQQPPEEAQIETARGLGPEASEGGLECNQVAAEADFSEDGLEEMCRGWLIDLELTGAAQLVKVQWNARLRSTAGYASFPAWRIELNPRLLGLEGQVIRTLKHELAHLIAYHRAGRRRIEPHGQEWKAACALLGIADEKACHQLPLPRARQKRTLAYRCESCGYVLHRVRRFRRPTACLSCCAKHNGGRYDVRFRFVPIEVNADDPIAG